MKKCKLFGIQCFSLNLMCAIEILRGRTSAALVNRFIQWSPPMHLFDLMEWAEHVEFSRQEDRLKYNPRAPWAVNPVSMLELALLPFDLGEA